MASDFVASFAGGVPKPSPLLGGASVRDVGAFSSVVVLDRSPLLGGDSASLAGSETARSAAGGVGFWLQPARPSKASPTPPPIKDVRSDRVMAVLVKRGRSAIRIGWRS